MQISIGEPRKGFGSAREVDGAAVVVSAIFYIISNARL